MGGLDGGEEGKPQSSGLRDEASGNEGLRASRFLPITKGIGVFLVT